MGDIPLNAAELTVRVAVRLGVVGEPTPARVVGQAIHMGVLTWCTAGDGWADSLARIFEYLAASDALCAAVGLDLELEAGKVAVWTQTAPTTWCIATKYGRVYFFAGFHLMAHSYTEVPALSTTSGDPRESLLACLAEVAVG